jgi:hypothetical protein
VWGVRFVRGFIMRIDDEEETTDRYALELEASARQ